MPSPRHHRSPLVPSMLKVVESAEGPGALLLPLRLHRSAAGVARRPSPSAGGSGDGCTHAAARHAPPRLRMDTDHGSPSSIPLMSRHTEVIQHPNVHIVRVSLPLACTSSCISRRQHLLSPVDAPRRRHPPRPLPMNVPLHNIRDRHTPIRSVTPISLSETRGTEPHPTVRIFCISAVRRRAVTRNDIDRCPRKPAPSQKPTRAMWATTAPPDAVAICPVVICRDLCHTSANRTQRRRRGTHRGCGLRRAGNCDIHAVPRTRA